VFAPYFILEVVSGWDAKKNEENQGLRIKVIYQF
jgi:hypothetical protein